MDSAEKILVVMLSSFLALFLLLFIVLVIYLIQFAKKMHIVADKANDIVDKAHDIAGNIDNVSDMFRKSAGPLALGRYFMNIAEMVNKHSKNSKHKGK